MSRGQPWHAFTPQHVPLGEWGVSARPEIVLSTLLGSCVAACLFDTDAGVGGLNHFLLPDGEDRMLYGSYSMEILVNGLLQRGARRRNLQAKAFGGARLQRGPSVIDVGRRNIEFVRSFLSREEIPLAAEDLGGHEPRRIWLHAASGRVWVEKLRPTEVRPLETQEQAMRVQPVRPSTGGDIDIFD